jgi:WD40 repeat protein
MVDRPAVGTRVGSEPRARFDVFLSHNNRDKPVVERIALGLRRAGIEPWLDKWHLTPGGRWQEELANGLAGSSACAVFIGVNDLGDWEREELAVAQNRAAADREFRLFPVLLPGLPDPFHPSALPPFLSTRMWVDFRGGDEDTNALQALVNAVSGLPLGPLLMIDTDSAREPYRGLQTFDEEHAEFFFGRDGDIQRLLEKLKSSRFLAVVGPSGSGKSSLVRAGLIPALRRGALPRSEEWVVCVLQPGSHPLTMLAAQLLRLYPQEAMQRTLADLDEDERTLQLAVALALAGDRPAKRVLWVIDQAEEVFTLCRDERERSRFLDNLLYAASVPDGRGMVVFTLRADFYPRAAAYAELAQHLSAHQFLVSPLDEQGLRQAIEEPARLVGLELEPGLIEKILDDIAHEPGSLPLLEHALLELWKRRDGRRLTLAAYKESGGVPGGVAQWADAVFAEFDARQQEIARQVLLRLTQPGEGTEDTRRRAARAELVTHAGEAEDAEEVVRTLIHERLLTASEEWVDISHEALIRGWPRLQAWLDDDRADLLVRNRITESARDWERHGRDDGLLYRGVRIGEAVQWRRRNEAALNDLEREFLDASAGLRERERRAGRRRIQLAIAGLITALVVVGSVAGFALVERQHALDRQRQLLSRELSVAAAAQLNQNVDLAALLSLEAYRARPMIETRSAILSVLPSLERAEATLRARMGLINQVAFSPNGRTLATADDDGRVQLWDILSRRPLGRQLQADRYGVSSVAFSPDGRTLASAGFGSVRLWDVPTQRPIGQPLRGHNGLVWNVAFSPDGRTLASAGNDRTVRFWDVATGRGLGRPLVGHTDFVTTVVFSPDGRLLASASGDRTIRLWDVGSRRPVGKALQGHTAAVLSVAFSFDGTTLASTADTADRTIRLWDVRTGRPLGRPLKGHTDAVWSAAFSLDGRTLASGAADHTVRLWDVATHRLIGRPLRGHTDSVRSVAFSPNGDLLASGSSDRTVRLWDIANRRPLSRTVTAESAFSSLAFSPDGRTLAVALFDHTVRLWDLHKWKVRGRPLNRHTDAVLTVAFSPDGKTLVSGGSDRVLRLWDVGSQRQRGEPLQGHTGAVLSLAFGADGKTVASGGDDGTARFWNVTTGRIRGQPLKAHYSPVWSVAFSADGKVLASAGDDWMIRLWDARSHSSVRALRGHSSSVATVVFSPDGKTLASGSVDHTIRLWDVTTGRTIGHPLRGHASGVSSLAFSPDGKVLASGSADRTVRLWDVATQRPLGQPLRGHGDRVSSVAFSPDGKTLASSSWDRTLRFWDAILWSSSFQALKNAVCKHVHRNLSQAEWSEFLPGEPYRRTCVQPSEASR